MRVNQPAERQNFKIGLLFSATGPYRTVGQSMLNGALLAIQQFNDTSQSITLEPVVVDPGGDTMGYAKLSVALLRAGIRHVIGCYTSSSRKEVIPYFEKYDGLLWYPSHYEGFETTNNVIYTGAAPNQHIVPLIDHLMRAFGRRAFCVGSNYIWAWENIRILREVVIARGGSVSAERYLPVGDVELRQIVAAVLDERPNFIFSALIGDSGYAFIRELRKACESRGIDQPSTMPVASCDLSEPGLLEIGEGAMDGHISSRVYFSSLPGAANATFVADYARGFPDQPITSADAEASYIAGRLLGLALAEAGSDEIRAVKAAVAGRRLEAPQGEVWVDQETSHCFLTPRIGRSTRAGVFEVIMEERAPLRPDPYLVHTPPLNSSVARPALRVVC